MKTSLACLLALLAGCAGVQRHHQSNALEYLYPDGAAAQPPTDVTLVPPVRVGLAFAPTDGSAATEQDPGWMARMLSADGGTHSPVDPFTPDQKQALLERMAGSFRGRAGIRSVDVIPESQLSPEGGFAELDRLKQAYGLDLMALVSYDQFQFSESGNSSWTYWTVVGAYVVEGEQNETRTVLDAVVYDIPSRTMLFTASGRSRVKEESTPIDLQSALREASAEGYRKAADDLVAQLDRALAGFQESSAGGTVRGPGTPAVTVLDAEGQPVEGGSGAGALGGLDALLALCLSGLALASRRRT